LLALGAVGCGYAYIHAGPEQGVTTFELVVIIVAIGCLIGGMVRLGGVFADWIKK
jgi:hypothetical protein